MRPIVRRSAIALAWAALALPALAADDIGTLFNSPEERARLDRLRRGEPVEAAAAPESVPRYTHKPALTGYVQRSDGRNTIWIDGRPVVIAAPDGKAVLQPNMVQPRAAGRLQAGEEADKPER